MALVYESKFAGISTKVFSDRLEYKAGWLSGVSSVPIKQIAGVEVAAIANKLTLVTTGGRKVVVVTSRKREVAEAIYWALNGSHGDFSPTVQPKSPWLLAATVIVLVLVVVAIASAIHG